MTAVYDYAGQNSKGEARGGHGEIGRTLALWVERKFTLGWQRLTVVRTDAPETVVAEIGLSADGQRTWWAES